MRFNNFLNRLRVTRIYLLLAFLTLAIVGAILLLLFNLFHVSSPADVFSAYANSLQNATYYEAESHIDSEVREEWSTVFEQMAEDESAAASLRQFFWKQAKWEFVSQSALAEDQNTLRFLVTAPNATQILTTLREEAESGEIDLSDPDLVRVGRDQESTLLYYLEDHFTDYSAPTISDEIILQFHKKGSFLSSKWYLVPTEQLHETLSGNLTEAMKTVFNVPLNLPKS